MKFELNKASRLFDKRKFDFLGRMFSREGLAPDLRIICSIACLQALGERQDLISMLKLAIDNQEDLELIYEVLLQGYLFCGYPRAIESFFCLQEALKTSKNLHPSIISFRAFDLSEVLLERGAAYARLVHGDKFERIRNKISALSPDLGYLMLAEGYGHVLSRKGLDLRARELAIVSSISALGCERQLNSHIRGCRNVGCGDAEIYESIFTGLLWLPAERIADSIRTWSDITGLAVTEPIVEFAD